MSHFHITVYTLCIFLFISLVHPIFSFNNKGINEISTIIVSLNGKQLENGTKIFANFKIIIVTTLMPDNIDWGDLILSNNTIRGNIIVKFPKKNPSGQYWTYSKNFYLHLENNKIYNFILSLNNVSFTFTFNASLQKKQTPVYYNNTVITTWTTLTIEETTIFSTSVYTTNTTTTTSITPISPTTKTEITTHTTTSLAKDTYIKNGYIIILMTFLVIFLIVFAFLIRLYKKRRIKVIKLDESELEYL